MGSTFWSVLQHGRTATWKASRRRRGIALSAFAGQLARRDDQPFNQLLVHHHHVVSAGVADMHRMQDVQDDDHALLPAVDGGTAGVRLLVGLCCGGGRRRVGKRWHQPQAGRVLEHRMRHAIGAQDPFQLVDEVRRQIMPIEFSFELRESEEFHGI